MSLGLPHIKDLADGLASVSIFFSLICLGHCLLDIAPIPFIFSIIKKRFFSYDPQMTTPLNKACSRSLLEKKPFLPRYIATPMQLQHVRINSILCIYLS